MDESALKILLDNLERSRSSLHGWLDFWTLLVVVGVALEVVFVIWEYAEDLHDFRRGIVHPPEKPIILLFVLGLLGAGLVAVGVAGELYIGVKAGQVETEIRKANELRISLLSKEAGDAAASATTAHKEAEAAKDAAGKAQQRAGAVATQTDELNRNLRDAKMQLEAVDVKRAKLEKSLIDLAVCNAPRVITSWSFTGLTPNTKKSYVDPLLPMAGQMVFIEFVPDAEARRAAQYIARTLADAEWSVQELKFVDGLKDGVSVQASVSTPTGNGIPSMSPHWHASDAEEKLLSFLHSYNWQAARGWPTDAQGKMIVDEKVLPAGAIRILIGLYPPAVYVSPPGQKELASRMEELKQEREKREAESKRKREEQLATLPPEVRQRLRQADAEWEAKTKSETSNSPCQVLNPLF
ncbi:MAG TPA: hypothetical protein VOA88_05930 [Candidatus Dormibacteraeota bacterium]|nr:hypothetical protein [Candidatus Dormibacteraeota bacterium]